MTRKIILLLPLAAYLAWAAYHLTGRGDRPFLLRWLDVSMALMLVLAATLVLKNLLFGKEDGGSDERGNT